MGWKIGLLGVLLTQRIGELVIAQRHTRWAIRQGGYEVGQQHYPLLVGVHLLFFVGLMVETWWLDSSPPSWWLVPLLLFLAVQCLRIWCMHTLGHYWNTRIMIIPSHTPVVQGPYRFLRHPNYLVVVAELLTVPLILGAYGTAVVVSALNLWILLSIRIPVEEQALENETDYKNQMSCRPRLFPWREKPE